MLLFELYLPVQLYLCVSYQYDFSSRRLYFPADPQSSAGRWAAALEGAQPSFHRQAFTRRCGRSPCWIKQKVSLRLCPPLVLSPALSPPCLALRLHIMFLFFFPCRSLAELQTLEN